MKLSAESSATRPKESIMKTTKTLLASLIIAAGTSLVAMPSIAQPADCMGYGPMGSERMQGMRADRMKQHQQRLHDALKLNPDQEKAWAKFQESHPFAKDGQRPSRAELDKLSAPERAEKMLELQKQHQEVMSKHVAAMKEFYGQLTPEQKKVFDQQQMPRGPRGQRGDRGPRPTPPQDQAPAR